MELLSAAMIPLLHLGLQYSAAAAPAVGSLSAALALAAADASSLETECSNDFLQL